MAGAVDFVWVAFGVAEAACALSELCFVEPLRVGIWKLKIPPVPLESKVRSYVPPASEGGCPHIAKSQCLVVRARRCLLPLPLKLSVHLPIRSLCKGSGTSV